MIGFCDVSDIRNSNVTLTPGKIGSTSIRERIETAEEIVISDLSKLYSQAQLISYNGSLVLKQLTTFKSMELILVKLFGATREVDKVDDIVYWRGRYTALLKSVLSGNVNIEFGGETESPVASPKISGNADGTAVQPIYTDRGIPGFEQS